MEPELTEAIEAFSTGQSDKPPRSEAIRRILRDWLIGHGYLKTENDMDELRKEITSRYPVIRSRLAKL